MKPDRRKLFKIVNKTADGNIEIICGFFILRTVVVCSYWIRPARQIRILSIRIIAVSRLASGLQKCNFLTLKFDQRKEKSVA
jgi:hypothetical protein